MLYLSLDGEVHDEEKTCEDKDTEIKLIQGKHYYTISYNSDILNWLEACREKAVTRPLVREGITH